jgi:hypothetical protein
MPIQALGTAKADTEAARGELQEVAGKVRKWKDAAAAAAAAITGAQTPDSGNRSHWGRAASAENGDEDNRRWGPPQHSWIT